MAKRYLVVIPVHKEAYLKSLNSPEKAASIMQEKLGRMHGSCPVDSFDKPMVMYSPCGQKKTALGVNDRATYFASLPSAEDDIYGTAIILGQGENGYMGLTEEVAIMVRDEVNGLRI